MYNKIKTKYRIPTNNGKCIKQLINNSSTTALERIAALATGGGGGGEKGLKVFYWRHFIKPQKCLASMEAS